MYNKHTWGSISEKNMQYYKLRVLIIIGMAVLFMQACSDTADDIMQRDELVVITRNAPTTYYEYKDDFAGVEYDLATGFAKSLGMKARFVVKDSVDEILTALENNEGDFAAAGLTHTAKRSNGFLFSTEYQKVQQQVVCRRGGPRPKNVSDLTGVKLVVPSKSSYVEQLTKLTKEFPDLKWKEEPDEDTEALLLSVWQRKVDCTIADSNIVAINRRYHPELVVLFNLSEPESLAWAFNKKKSGLKRKVNDWLEEQKSSGQLSRTFDKYYGFIKVFDYVDNRRYQRAINKKLPAYKALFQRYAAQYKIPWTLLAAQSYQESHWNPKAKSPTGVRGMMMLTRITANELKITNRLDPKQSIKGGAKYLSGLIRRIPEDVKQPDRTWFALAAYNIGMGHFHDARVLAKRLGKNPSLWNDMESVFPLLSHKKYYKSLKHGYARGSEPVRYVHRIRDYQDILERNSVK